jgi:cytochrome c oxidase subunit IV
MTAIVCFIWLMIAEAKYTVFTRFIYFVLGS